MTITLKQYWKNRDVEYAAELTPLIRTNAVETVRRANLLLTIYHAATGTKSPTTSTVAGDLHPSTRQRKAQPKIPHI